MLTLEEIFFASQIAIVAYIFVNILTLDGKLFCWYDDLLIDLEQKSKFLANLLGRCDVCLGGQLATWVWLYMNNNEYIISVPEAIIRNILFTSFTIFTVQFINNAFDKWKT